MSEFKVIQIPFGYYPEPVGGTEIYVEALSLYLQRLEINTLIAAPRAGLVTSESIYSHNGLKVRRFDLAHKPPANLLNELYGEGDPVAAENFSRVLDEERPDVVHLHAFTRGCSILLVRAAKARGIPVIFTYHTPTVSCPRGTLLRWGRDVCDGLLEVQRCSACKLQSLGLANPLSQTLAYIPPSIGRIISTAKLSGGVWTALRMSQLVETRKSVFMALAHEVDRLVVLCQWSRDLLVKNGVPEAKIKLCRHGLGQDSHDQGILSEPTTYKRAHSRVRLAFFGRLHPTKGVDVLIRALRHQPNAWVELHIFGINEGEANSAYIVTIRQLAKDDTRIEFRSSIPAAEVVNVMKGYDFIVVPSQWLETGPLVVLEAFAAGVPVLGSNLGGIAELVEHEHNGLLVEPNSVTAWSQVIRRCSDDSDLALRLRDGVRPPREMMTVAMEMKCLYDNVIGSNKQEMSNPL